MATRSPTSSAGARRRVCRWAKRAIFPKDGEDFSMDPIVNPETIDRDRRDFLGAAMMALAAAELGMSAAASAQSGAISPAVASPASGASFGPLKQIDAGALNVGYAEAGPADGLPVLLLHGWPYDIHSFVDVAPMLAAAGHRVVVPYLRGYGTTRFLSSDTLRNGQ